MRTGLIAFGVIFIVLGGILYYMPNPSAGALVTTANGAATASRTSFASVTVPIQLILASLIIGAILLVLGLIIPHPYAATVHKSDEDEERDHLVQTREEDIRGRRGQRKIVRERREHHRTV